MGIKSKGNILINLSKVANNKKGQIFPFLVLMMIIMVVAIMAFVNVAQVNNQKISAINAADAGAYAGAAQLASAANAIARLNNTQMWRTSYGNQVLFLGMSGVAAIVGLGDVTVQAAFWKYVGLCASNILKYASILKAAYHASISANAAAAMTAFSNAGIEEAEQRVGTTTGSKRPSSEYGLTQYLNDLNFYDKKTQENTTNQYDYSWSKYYYNITTGQEMQRSNLEQNKISIIVNKPKDNGLAPVPFPVVPISAFWWKWLPPVTDPFTGSAELAACIAQEVDAEAMEITLAAEPPYAAIAFAADIVATDIFSGFYKNYYTFAESLQLSYMNPWLVAPMICYGSTVVPCCPTGGFWFKACVYLVPFPWVATLQDENAEVSVEVKNFVPERNLGLWLFKQNTSTGKAKAEIHGGNIMSYDGGYEVKLTEAAN